MAGSEAKVDLANKDHEDLLNTIDQLRSQGISHIIDLPQIIVVGDQSAGKSSVLEAISRLTFPTKDGLCTRFATELIVRRSPQVTSSISIVPDVTRSADDKKLLQERFKVVGDAYSNLAAIVQSASDAMGLNADKKFSKDVLRIELSGPHLPDLTLVDLPGLFHSGSATQSSDDAKNVRALVTSYMKKTRSIILAVVSAMNDMNNQIVLKLAKEYDPHGTRTLGIVTKPDYLNAGSDTEKQYISLINNKEVHFDLGWHVIKNRSYQQRTCTHDERDKFETTFFGQGVWASFSQAQVGIESLKSRLSGVLQAQILLELPNLVKEVQDGINESEMKLSLLGKSRGTIEEQRMHLHDISQVFTERIKNAVAGTYELDPYFDDANTEAGYLKRICAMVMNKGDEFTKEMNTKGMKYKIVDKPVEKQTRGQPLRVTKEQRLEGVRTLIERNRGRELSTVVKQETVTALFREQSSPWAALVKTNAESIFKEVTKSVVLALDATADTSTCHGILRRIVNPALSFIKTGFDEAIVRALRPHLQAHPITTNHYTTDNLQSMRRASEEDRVAGVLKEYFKIDPRKPGFHKTQPMEVDVALLLQKLMGGNEPDMMKFTCEEALWNMESYYKDAKKSFVSNIATYAFQEALLDKLEILFPPSKIFALSEDVVREIAGETAQSQAERALYTRKLTVLKSALDALLLLDAGGARFSSHSTSESTLCDSEDDSTSMSESSNETSGSENAKAD